MHTSVGLRHNKLCIYMPLRLLHVILYFLSPRRLLLKSCTHPLRKSWQKSHPIPVLVGELGGIVREPVVARYAVAFGHCHHGKWKLCGSLGTDMLFLSHWGCWVEVYNVVIYLCVHVCLIFFYFFLLCTVLLYKIVHVYTFLQPQLDQEFVSIWILLLLLSYNSLNGHKLFT